MEKHKWKSAEEIIRKILHKDSLNAEARYILSWFYTEPDNPSANLDSAYRYCLGALRDYEQSSLKEKERLRRFPLDSMGIVLQRKRIDSTAFDRVRKINTEKGYSDFINTYTTADERLAASELRDEVAWLDALKTNTLESFQGYSVKYPSSSRAEEALQRYEKLLYTEKTRDGKLLSYESFLAAFPGSSYRRDAEQNIFEISTASGRIQTLNSFLRKYPTSYFRKRAMALLYHLMRDDEHEWPSLSDSLRNVQRNEKGFWIPFIKNDKFGFFDQFGTERINPEFDSIPHTYLCGNVQADVLIVSGGIINRAGNWVWKGRVGEVEDLGIGFLNVAAGGCHYCVHKSGWNPGAECYEGVKIIARHFLAVRSHGKWGLHTLAGKVLFEPQFDDVQALDTLIILAWNGKKTIATSDQIAGIADKNPFKPSLVFDDVRRLRTGNYLVKNGPLEGIVNEKLEFVVALDRHTITLSSVGFILERNQKYSVTGLLEVSSDEEFDQVLFYANWVKLQKDKSFFLYNLLRNRKEPFKPDSIWFQTQLAFARHRDTVRVFMNSGAFIAFGTDDKIVFLRSADSSRYFFISDKKKKTVFNALSGKRLFAVSADGIDYIGQNAFIVTRGNKKGLVRLDGKQLLPADFTAIVPLSGNWASVLKDKKFGIYNFVTNKLISPIYDRNVIPFSSNLLIAYKSGAYGFIDPASKPRGEFEFDEIRPWNDTSAMVKKNFQWMIYGIRSRSIRMREIKEYRFITTSANEDIAIVRKGNYYGVISNRRGELIPANFTDVVNIGSEEEPVFFTEKNVEEAGIHVVIYYDRNGKVLRKQALEDSEYERIYCEEN